MILNKIELLYKNVQFDIYDNIIKINFELSLFM